MKTPSRAMALIGIFSIIITMVIGLVSTTKSDKYLEKEINAKIVLTAESNANEVNARLNHLTGITDGLLANVQDEFDVNQYSNRAGDYIAELAEQQAPYIENCLKTSDRAYSLYVVFDPNLSDDPIEIWYISDGSSLKRIYVDPKKKKEDLNNRSDKNMEYYFKAADGNEGVWTGLYYDDDIDEKVFSYSRSIYINNDFVGIVGSDINAKNTEFLVKNLKIYDEGFAAILDEDGNYVVEPEKVSTKEKAQVSKVFKSNAAKHKDDKSGIVKYSYNDEEYVSGFAKLDNGWMMIITQPSVKAYMPIRSVRFIMIGMSILLALILLIFIAVVSRPIILKQQILEEENKEKDVLLAYQSRQAKVGEMVGNVSHQWKQPLNSINLVMANLLDSYDYGDFDRGRLEASVKKVELITGKMSDIITSFSGFLKPSTKDPEAFELAKCIDMALSMMEESLAKNRINVIRNYDYNLKGFGYENEFTNAVFNVLNNARDSIVSSRKPSGVIKINTIVGDADITIEIEDNGQGMSEEIRERAFEPYFTTKKGDGTGIGLSITKNLIESRMKGRIAVENCENGAKCVMVIPRDCQ